MTTNLMKGMAALCICAAFASCSKEVFDANFEDKQKEHAYEEAFIQKYGPVSPTQDWDFTRSAASATTRAEVGESEVALEGTPFGTSGFNWVWSYSDGTSGELPKADLNALWAVRDAIRDAIAAAPSIKWEPSKYENVLFRTFTVLNDAGNDSGNKTYHNFGFSNGTHNYWLARGSAEYGYWYGGYDGTKFMNETRYIDFTKLKDNIRWFAISQRANNETPFYASDKKITYFKEVTVTVTSNKYVDPKTRRYTTKEYTETFWAFNCTGAVKSNDNLILWVRPTKVPDVITSKRYMCEDLGGVTGSDIDFNDIVFDLVDTNGNQKCYVRALGGTLDIAIKVGDNVVFRKTTNQNPTFAQTTMYNTGWDGQKGVYSQIDFDEPLAEVEVTGWDPERNNVSIVVYNPNATPAESIYEFPVVGAIPKMVAVELQRNWKEEKAGVPDFAWFSDYTRK